MTPTRQSDLEQFLHELLRDVDAHGLKSLEDYLERYPNLSEEVRAEHAAWARQCDVTHTRGSSVAGEDLLGLPGSEFLRSEILPDGNRFRLIRGIGRGGMGVVYKCHDKKLDRIVVLKTLSPRLGAHPRATERMRREAQVLGRLDHEHVCAIYEVLEQGDRLWVVLPFIRGETLSRRLDRARQLRSADPETSAYWLLLASPRDEEASIPEQSLLREDTRGLDSGTEEDPFDLRPLLRFFEEASRAVHAVHEAGIIHRDLKPANIIIGTRGAPIILDFGLAHDESDEAPSSLTDSGAVLGTPPYMAPEQVRGECCDARSDVWSLGVMIYEALTLERPFDGDTRKALEKRILEEPPPSLRKRLSRIPTDLEAVCLKALEKDPSKRYQSAEDLATDLRNVRTLQPTIARPIGSLGRAFRRIQRHKRRFLAATVVGILLALSLTLGLRERALTHTAALEKAFRDYYGAQAQGKAAPTVARKLLLDALRPLGLADRLLIDPRDTHIHKRLLDLLDQSTRGGATSDRVGKALSPRGCIVGESADFQFVGLIADGGSLVYRIEIRRVTPGGEAPLLFSCEFQQAAGDPGKWLSCTIPFDSTLPRNVPLHWSVRLLCDDPKLDSEALFPTLEAPFRIVSDSSLTAALAPPAQVTGILGDFAVLDQLLAAPFIEAAKRSIDRIQAAPELPGTLRSLLTLYRAKWEVLKGNAQRARELVHSLETPFEARR